MYDWHETQILFAIVIYNSMIVIERYDLSDLV